MQTAHPFAQDRIESHRQSREPDVSPRPRELRTGSKLPTDKINPAFAQDGLGDDCDCVHRGSLLKGRNIVRWNENYIRKQRQERLAIPRLPGNGKSTRGPTVEGVLKSDDAMKSVTAPVRKRLGRLYRGLHGFRTSVAQKDAVKPAPLSEFFRY